MLLCVRKTNRKFLVLFLVEVGWLEVALFQTLYVTLIFIVNVAGKKLYWGHICGPYCFNKTDECVFQKKIFQYLVECATVCSWVYTMKMKTYKSEQIKMKLWLLVMMPIISSKKYINQMSYIKAQRFIFFFLLFRPNTI